MDRQLEPRLGVDIGRVIIEGPADPGGGDTDFFGQSEDEAMRTPAVAGAFATLARLVDRFGGRVWLVSTCGERIEERSRRWLAHHRFHEETGIPVAHVRFCRERADKAGHASELGLTHFVDDRADVHGHLAGIVAHRYLFGPGPAPAGVEVTPTWDEAENAIGRSLAQGE
jgi:hypothetical protein